MATFQNSEAGEECIRTPRNIREIGVALNRGLAYGRDAVMRHVDLSVLQCIVRDHGGDCDDPVLPASKAMPLAPNFEKVDDMDMESEPSMILSPMSSAASLSLHDKVVPPLPRLDSVASVSLHDKVVPPLPRLDSAASISLHDKVVPPLPRLDLPVDATIPSTSSSTASALASSKRSHRRPRRPPSELDLADTASLCSSLRSSSTSVSSVSASSLRSSALGSSSSSTCSGVSSSEGRWDDSFSWRFARVWEDLPSPSPLVVSPCIEKEPVILCCARNNNWCPITVERSAVIGTLFFGQGWALKFIHDYSDLFTLNVTNPSSGDPKHIYFQSADDGHHLLCTGSTLCKSSQIQALTGPWAKMHLQPAVPGNHFCFHLYCPDSLASNASGLPICYDEESGRFRHMQPEPGCQPAVFALQTASSALLLKEIVELTNQVSEHRSLFSTKNNLLMLQKLACMGKKSDQSEDLQKLVNRRDADEQQLVFLEDNLAFLKEQLKSRLKAAGIGAAPGGLPEACLLDVEDNFSCKSALSTPRATPRGTPRATPTVSPLASARRLLRLL